MTMDAAQSDIGFCATRTWNLRDMTRESVGMTLESARNDLELCGLIIDFVRNDIELCFE